MYVCFLTIALAIKRVYIYTYGRVCIQTFLAHFSANPGVGYDAASSISLSETVVTGATPAGKLRTLYKSVKAIPTTKEVFG